MPEFTAKEVVYHLSQEVERLDLAQNKQAEKLEDQGKAIAVLQTKSAVIAVGASTVVALGMNLILHFWH